MLPEAIRPVLVGRPGSVCRRTLRDGPFIVGPRGRAAARGPRHRVFIQSAEPRCLIIVPCTPPRMLSVKCIGENIFSFLNGFTSCHQRVYAAAVRTSKASNQEHALNPTTLSGLSGSVVSLQHCPCKQCASTPSRRGRPCWSRRARHSIQPCLVPGPALAQTSDLIH